MLQSILNRYTEEHMTAIILAALVHASASASTPAVAAATQPAVTLRVPGVLQTVPPGTVHIDGWLGQRIEANITGRLTHVPMDELLAGFQNRPGKQNWIGEHIGKWLHAACLAYEYSGNPELKEMLDKAVPELLATQLPDGYLGTYDDTKRWKSWDVWVHKYDMIGLLSYHQLTGDEASLAASRRIADMLIDGFGHGKRDITKSGEHVGMAASSVLEPMVKLYVITGEKKYLDFCDYILESWEQPHGPKLISSLLDHGKVLKTANAKAYEMMSNLVGLCDLYRVVGDERYLRAVRNAWEDINAHQMYITGGVSYKEHFQPDDRLKESGNVAETCANVTWMQLCAQLFTITGDSKYYEPIERLIYNHLLGAQSEDGNDWCYFTPLEGKKQFTENVNCCHSSGPRGVGLIPPLAYTTGDKLLHINLIASSTFKGDVPGVGMVEVDMATHYPLNEKAVITIRPEKPAKFTIKIRIPGGKGGQISTNGEEWPAAADAPVLARSIEREWKADDTLELTLPAAPQWIIGKGLRNGKVAIKHGPFVLCSSERWDAKSDDPPSIDYPMLRWLPPSSGGEPQALLLGPYAVVQKEEFKVWIPVSQPAE